MMYDENNVARTTTMSYVPLLKETMFNNAQHVFSFVCFIHTDFSALTMAAKILRCQCN